jgi:hypothetical protein
MRRLAPVWSAAAALAFSTACGSSSSGGSDRPTADSPNVVVVRVVTRGGFAAETSQQALVPRVSVFGDGRVIITGPTTLEFPGPALPNLQEFRVSSDGLTRILDEAGAAGLLDDPPPDYGDAGITDQPTTTVTVRADGATHRVDVYALDFTDGLTAEQRGRRERLNRFIQLIGDPDALRDFVVTGTRRYQPTALAVIIRASDTTDTETRPWPLDDLADAGVPYRRLPGARCKVFYRGQLAAALDAARTAREGDLWESAGATYTLQFRPLLPDQRGCDDLEPS